jgi:hypothetical protein
VPEVELLQVQAAPAAPRDSLYLMSRAVA